MQFDTFFCCRTCPMQLAFSMTPNVSSLGRSPERRSMTKKRKPDAKNIEPGMAVKATKGDLGEEDISKPKVSAVAQNRRGDVEKLIVQKGVIFKKTLEIPADHVQSIDEDSEREGAPGKVTVEVSKQ